MNKIMFWLWFIVGALVYLIIFTILAKLLVIWFLGD